LEPLMEHTFLQWYQHVMHLVFY